MDFFKILIKWKKCAEIWDELIYRNVKNNFQHMLKTLFFATWAGFVLQFDTFSWSFLYFRYKESRIELDFIF